MSDPKEEIIEQSLLNGLVLNIHYLPEEIIAHILSFVEIDTLLQCRKVCKTWYSIVDRDVWRILRKNCKTKSLSKLSRYERVQLDLPLYVHYCIYKHDPFEKNLMKNNSGKELDKYWNTSGNHLSLRFGDDGNWSTEAIPVGADPLPASEDFEGYAGCFATSYRTVVKSQIINFRDYGFTNHIMDEFQPIITASEWYAGRFDCGCQYKLTVSLLDEHKKVVYQQESNKTVKQWKGSAWEKVVFTFEGYGLGIRFVELKHEGRDTQFWSGHYGSKMAGAVVKISLPQTIPNPNAVLICSA